MVDMGMTSHPSPSWININQSSEEKFDNNRSNDTHNSNDNNNDGNNNDDNNNFVILAMCIKFVCIYIRQHIHSFLSICDAGKKMQKVKKGKKEN